MSDYLTGNAIRLLRNGAEYFPQLLLAIEQAQHSVYLQSYIFELDNTGLTVAQALQCAAQRGVQVHVLLDGFGCKELSPVFIAKMRQQGVELAIFRPKISPWTLKKNRLRRLHRKLVVVDGVLAFVGGINIIDDMSVPGGHGPRIDYAVALQGPVAQEIALSMHRLWRWVVWHQFKSVMHQIGPAKTFAQTVKVRYVLRDNILHRHDIEQAYLQCIADAKHEILIANAYFVPGRRFRLALIEAAQRGVQVRLLLQGCIEYWVMLASHAFYSDFLQHGIHIYEYKKSFMHSKVAVFDGQIATVGSSNIDPFSLLLAYEANVFVDDKMFAQTLQQDLQAAIADGAQIIDARHWQQGNIVKRTVSWLIYGLLRFMLGTIGKEHS